MSKKIKLNKYCGVPYSYQPSKRKSNIITNVDEFNGIIEFCQSTNHQYTLTAHGALQTGIVIKNGWFWDNRNAVSNNTYGIGLVFEGKIYQFTFWPGKDLKEEKGITGRHALARFSKYCGKIAATYATKDENEILRIKETIKKPLICLTATGKSFQHLEIMNVKHLDIHSAYSAALCKKHPEFFNYFNELYQGRKEHEEYKAYLNYCIGAMQSLKLTGNRYPLLAKDAINGTIDYMEKLTQKLRNKGFVVIGYNTDGIFYMHPQNLEYHDEDEGDAMGQWRTDHHFDKIRFKSAGSYEYVEDGVYHAVVRGIPRELSATFQWGDIYKHHPKRYMLLNNKILEVDEEDGEESF